MKKAFKKLLVMALSLMMCGSIWVTNASAADLDHENLTIGESSSSIQPRAEIYCDKSPNYKHQVYARGTGILYRRNADGSRTQIFNNGCTWQCTYCLHVIVTKGEAALGQAIGNYATWNPGYITATWGTELTASNIWYTSSSTLAGYNFRYN
ncbi:MAG: hypothetical protein E6308_21095 [Escherichia coli]|jgi:hypothetical protein|nr:hypothetical protein [Escherichia coli]